MLNFGRFLAALLSPLPFIVLMLIVGTFLILSNNRINLAKSLITISTLFLVLISVTGLPKMMIKPLENRYKPYSALYGQLRSDMNNGGKPLKWVVVLAGGIVNDPDIPISSEISSPAVIRLVEGIRVMREFPGSKLVLTGGSPADADIKEADMMKTLAIELGVDRNDIKIENKSLSTKQQVSELKNIIGGEDFALVTSAAHTSRAISLFEEQNMRPHPLPTDFLLKDEKDWLGIPVPNSSGFELCEHGFYEIWARAGTIFE